MKRYLALVGGLIFVLGFSAVAFAIHAEIPSDTQAVVAKGSTQLTLGGEIRARGEYKEVDFDNDTSGDSYYDSRVRLSVDAQVTPNTRGFIQVEGGKDDVGDNYTWGQSPSGNDGAKGGYPVGNSKRGQFNVLQAWILHKGSGLLGVPAGVKVGHMPLALGNKLFFAHDKFGDDAIVFFVDPTKELHIGLLTAKFREGKTNSADDSDAYVGLFAYKGQGFNLSGDVTYVDGQRDFGVDNNVHFWNFGLRGDAKVDPVTLRADLELQTGKITGEPDTKFRGYAVLLGADAKLSGINLTAEFAYGSGDNDNTDNKIKSFVTSLGADPHFTYVYEYRTPNACGNANGGLCNTWYIKLGAAGSLTKEISASLNAYLLRAAKTPSGVDKEIGFEL
ncbi:MAG: alginate export family protein, partial [Thermodesulfovibrionales bacterium]